MSNLKEEAELETSTVDQTHSVEEECLLDDESAEDKGGVAFTLADNGAIAQYIDGFSPRPDQQKLAVAIESCLESKGVLVAEAGTGTGKTFAYLIPALLSGKKTIVSTGTKNLQDQLYHRDLPTVRKALGMNLKTALLQLADFADMKSWDWKKSREILKPLSELRSQENCTSIQSTFTVHGRGGNLPRSFAEPLRNLRKPSKTTYQKSFVYVKNT